jgi:hypothetical protein
MHHRSARSHTTTASNVILPCVRADCIAGVTSLRRVCTHVASPYLYNTAGSFRQLQAIRKHAFAFNEANTSSVELVSLPILLTIEDAAFYNFKGRLAIHGRFPLLVEIGRAYLISTLTLTPTPNPNPNNATPTRTPTLTLTS